MGDSKREPWLLTVVVVFSLSVRFKKEAQKVLTAD